MPTYLPATRYGGPIQSVHGLCKALVGLGNEVHVFTTNVDGLHNSDVPLGRPVTLDGVSVWYFPCRFLRRIFYAPSMAHELRKGNSGFDIVHLHSVFLWPTSMAARWARSSSLPYVLAPRGMLNAGLIRRKAHFIKTAWIALFERKNIERAAMIHVTSQLESTELAKLKFKLPLVSCVPNGIEGCPNLVTAGGPDSSQMKDPYVLFLGRINWKKGLDRLLRAWKSVPTARLVVAGNDEDAYIPELQKIVREEGIASRVSFVGQVAGNRKWDLLRNASIFVLPSYSENFGIAVLEAMAAGCPVVVTPEVGLAATVLDTGCGKVIDGSPESISETLSELLRDPESREKMGAIGRGVATRQFSWETIAHSMEQVYSEVVNANQIAAKRALP